MFLKLYANKFGEEKLGATNFFRNSIVEESIVIQKEKTLRTSKFARDPFLERSKEKMGDRIDIRNKDVAREKLTIVWKFCKSQLSLITCSVQALKLPRPNPKAQGKTNPMAQGKTNPMAQGKTVNFGSEMRIGRKITIDDGLCGKGLSDIWILHQH